MELRLESDGVRVNPWVEEHVRSEIVFAVWHHPRKVGRVEVRLGREPAADGAGAVRCRLLAVARDDSHVAAEAAGRDVFEAVQEAALQLELALFTSGPDAATGTPAARLAA